MKVLVVSLMVLSMSVMAADKKVTVINKPKTDTTPKTLNVEGGGEKEDIVDQTATLTDKNPMKAHVTCKTEDGQELKQGDADYKACLKKVKADKHNKNNPKADVEVKFEK